MRQIDTSSSTSIKTSANEGMEKLFDGDINTKVMYIRWISTKNIMADEKANYIEKIYINNSQ